MKRINALLLITLVITLCFTACVKSGSESENDLSTMTHKVKFNNNDEGLGLKSSETMVFHGDPAGKPKDPMRSGYAFEGWFTDDGSFANAYDFSMPVTEDISIYGKWSKLALPEMVWVEGGSFLMGSNDEIDLDARPVRKITLDGFYISKFEVTQKLYTAVTGFNPSYFQNGRPPAGYLRGSLPEGETSGDELPVEMVTWYDAIEFCNKLSKVEGLTPAYTITNRAPPSSGWPIFYMNVAVDWNANGYRLPTEAEWEYAAKGGNGMGPYFVYSGSNEINTVAWYNKGARIWDARVRETLSQPSMDDSPIISVSSGYYVVDHFTHPVGTKAPNSLGIYDMSGNVWEWCWDWFGDYPNVDQTNPKGPASGDYRVKRGGTHLTEADENIVRVAYRDYFFPYMYNCAGGIRLVRSN